MKKNVSEVSLHEKDTGSSEVQIALLTDKIEILSKHVKQFKAQTLLSEIQIIKNARQGNFAGIRHRSITILGR